MYCTTTGCISNSQRSFSVNKDNRNWEIWFEVINCNLYSAEYFFSWKMDWWSFFMTAFPRLESYCWLPFLLFSMFVVFSIIFRMEREGWVKAMFNKFLLNHYHGPLLLYRVCDSSIDYRYLRTDVRWFDDALRQSPTSSGLQLSISR